VLISLNKLALVIHLLEFVIYLLGFAKKGCLAAAFPWHKRLKTLSWPAALNYGNPMTHRLLQNSIYSFLNRPNGREIKQNLYKNQTKYIFIIILFIILLNFPPAGRLFLLGVSFATPCVAWGKSERMNGPRRGPLLQG